MVRSRWAALALGCCALFISGCGNWFEGGWFSRFRTTSLARDCDCCETAFGAPTLEGGTAFDGGPGLHGGPGFDGGPVLEGGPGLIPPSHQGAFTEPPAFAPQIGPQGAPPVAPPPRIVPIPHAAPVPYTPTH